MKIDLERYNFFFFDFDGVIVDSVGIKTEAFALMYKPCGKEVVSKVIRHHEAHGGISRFEKICYYHKNYLNRKISDGELRKLARVFSALVEERVLKAPFVKGATDFLELLKSKRKKMFIISATPEEEIKKIAKKRRLGKYFRDIKGSPRTKKENLEFLIKRNKLKVSECIYFGDAKEDLETASSTKVRFIPINYFDRGRGYRDFGKFLKDNRLH